MRNLFFLIILISTSAFSQNETSSSPSSEQNINTQNKKLVRAIDDRRMLIRQRRDLLDRNKKPVPQAEVQTIDQ